MTDCLTHAPTLLADPLAMLMMALAGACLSAPLAYVRGRLDEQRRHIARMGKLLAVLDGAEVPR